MASPSAAGVEPQNERGHAYRFSPLPQSETETDDNDDEDQLPLSINVESTTTMPPIITYSYSYSDEIFSISARICEMIQDLIGVTIVMILIFLPLYRHLGAPNEDPVPPFFILDSMYVSNFTATAATGELAATWAAKFTFINTDVPSIYFRSIDFTMLYKENSEHPLSTVSSYPFYLDKGQDVKLHLKFATTGWKDGDQQFVENWLVEEMGKDMEKDGSLSFGMQMKVQAIYYGGTWVSDVVMSPHCEGLTVQFLPNKDSGRLANPNRNFSVPIEWKPFSFFS